MPIRTPRTALFATTFLMALAGCGGGSDSSGSDGLKLPSTTNLQPPQAQVTPPSAQGAALSWTPSAPAPAYAVWRYPVPGGSTALDLCAGATSGTGTVVGTTTGTSFIDTSATDQAACYVVVPCADAAGASCALPTSAAAMPPIAAAKLSAAPTATVSIALPPASVFPGDTVVLAGSATGVQGTAAYEWKQLGGTKVTLSAPTGRETRFTAPAVPAGKADELVDFELSVADSRGFQSKAKVAVTVRPRGGPIVSATPLRQAQPGQLVSLHAIGAGGTQYQWVQTGPVDASGQIPANLRVTLTNANTANPSFTAPPSIDGGKATLSFQVTHTDPATGQRATETQSVQLQAPATGNSGQPLSVAGADPKKPGAKQKPVPNAAPASPGVAGSVVYLTVPVNGGKPPFTWSWRQVGGPAAAAVSGTNGARLAVTLPSVGSAADLRFEATITDADGNRVTAIGTARALPPLVAPPTPAVPPLRIVLAPVQATAGVPVLLSAPVNGGSVSQTGGAQGGLTGQPAGSGGTGTTSASFTPTQAGSGGSTAEVTISGTNAQGQPVQYAIPVLVQANPALAPVTAPVLVPPAAPALSPDTALAVAVTGATLANEAQAGVALGVNATGGRGSYTYAWKYDGSIPAGASVSLSDTSSSHPTLATPSVSADTLLSFTVTVSDGKQTVNKPVTLLVQDTIRPLALTAPPAAQVVGGNPVSTSVQVAGGQAPYSYRWEPIGTPPAGVTASGTDTAVLKLSTSVVSAAVTASYKLTVTDAGNRTATAQADVAVLPAPSGAPGVAAPRLVLAPLSAVAGQAVQITVPLRSATATQISGPVAALATLVAPSASQSAFSVLTPAITTESDTLEVVLRGQNSAGQTAEMLQVVNLTRPATVAPPQLPPQRVPPVPPPAPTPLAVKACQPAYSVNEGNPFTLSACATGGNNAYSYSWQLVSSKPAAVQIPLTDANTSHPGLIAPQVAADTQVTFRVTVNDTAGASASNTLVLTVRDVLVPLRLVPGPDSTVYAGQSIKIAMAATGGTAPYRWTWTSGAASNTVQLALTGTDTPVVTATAPAVCQAQTVTLVAALSDAAGRSTLAQTQVQVQPDPTKVCVPDASLPAQLVPIRTVAAPPRVVLVGEEADLFTGLPNAQFQQISGVHLDILAGPVASPSGGTRVRVKVNAISATSDSAEVKFTGTDSRGVPTVETVHVSLVNPPGKITVAVPVAQSNTPPPQKFEVANCGSRGADANLKGVVLGACPSGGSGQYTYTWTYVGASPSSAVPPAAIALRDTNTSHPSFDPPAGITLAKVQLAFLAEVSDGTQTVRVPIGYTLYNVGGTESSAFVQTVEVAPGSVVTLHSPAPFGGQPPYRYTLKSVVDSNGNVVAGLTPCPGEAGCWSFTPPAPPPGQTVTTTATITITDAVGNEQEVQSKASVTTPNPAGAAAGAAEPTPTPIPDAVKPNPPPALAASISVAYYRWDSYTTAQEVESFQKSLSAHANASGKAVPTNTLEFINWRLTCPEKLPDRDATDPATAAATSATCPDANPRALAATGGDPAGVLLDPLPFVAPPADKTTAANTKVLKLEVTVVERGTWPDGSPLVRLAKASANLMVKSPLLGSVCYTCGDYEGDAKRACTRLEIIRRTEVTCPNSKPYCMNDIFQPAGQSPSLYKRCVDEPTARQLWYIESSDKVACFRYDSSTFRDDLVCHLACYGDRCNQNALPPDTTLWKP
ncbi:PKD domain-containing protein [Inhella crocodyli]|uniref:Ig-like domain-containing protein n=1 Tax=Inhella crocodyli TaxID=2499851 RepID=A0A3S2UT28_9BURK|nr:hypothetical protein [Inhella crocodyli]RVT83851.1 hypothetical protein EOD73_14915 [Inhella crocodyli]